MKITIEYESSWRNSFLEGSNNEALPKTGRKFIGSMTSLKKPENFIKREITTDTVMGILNRLIGDQRKLYQSRNDTHYFFKDIEPIVSFVDVPKVINNEMTYIRNITGSTDQSSFSGLVVTQSPVLTSEFSSELWSILMLNVDDLCEFIIDESFIVPGNIDLSPTNIADIGDGLKKLKKMPNEGIYKKSALIAKSNFPELIKSSTPEPYFEKDMMIKPERLYAAALYIQFNRLKNRFDMKSALTKSGLLAGFSKRGFNGRRDFMKNFVTGGEKKIWGSPYIHEEFIKGEGKTKHLMTKASGTLEIIINVSRDKAKEIKRMVDSAGVSSFYLGKKGLAYVGTISTREES